MPIPLKLIAANDPFVALVALADVLDGKAPATIKPWKEAANRFRDQKILHGNAIKATTWEKNYGPVIAMAVDLLSSAKAPGRPDDLLDQCIRDWEPGSRARQIRAQSLSQFLRYCVDRESFPELWSPPVDLRSHVGVKSANGSPTRKGDPLTDQQIIDLVAGLPKDETGNRCDSRTAPAARDRHTDSVEGAGEKGHPAGQPPARALAVSSPEARACRRGRSCRPAGPPCPGGTWPGSRGC